MLAGIIQLSSTRDVERNLEKSRELAAQAAAQGATWLLYPENAPYLGKDREKLSVAQPIDGSIAKAYQDIAREHACWLTLGSFPEQSPSPSHTYNTQLLISPSGEITSVYRKMHLFDVELEDGTILEESASILGGETLELTDVTANGETFCVGLSICYDLRFPEFYRELRARGAHVLTVPAAFTMQTGREHWHALLRARAIENQCYVLAPDQWGYHFPGRASYGQSVAYDPWGRMLGCAPERECAFVVDLDMPSLEAVRAKMPCWSHRKIT